MQDLVSTRIFPPLINKANSFWGVGWGVQDLVSTRIFPPLINKAIGFGGWGWGVKIWSGSNLFLNLLPPPPQIKWSTPKV